MADDNELFEVVDSLLDPVEARAYKNLSKEDRDAYFGGIAPDPIMLHEEAEGTESLVDNRVIKVTSGPTESDGISTINQSQKFSVSAGTAGAVAWDKTAGRPIVLSNRKDTDGLGRRMAGIDVSTNMDPNNWQYGYPQEDNMEKDSDTRFVRAGVSIVGDTAGMFTGGDIKLCSRSKTYNSRGHKVLTGGIYLNATGVSESKMQPAVLGNKMEDCVANIYDSIDVFYGIMQTFMDLHISFCKALVGHPGFISPFQGGDEINRARVCPELVADIQSYMIDLVSITCMSFDAQRTGLSFQKSHFASKIGKGRITSPSVLIT